MTTYYVTTDHGDQISCDSDADAARGAAQAAANHTGKRVWLEYDVEYADGRPTEGFREAFLPENDDA